jgi:hypothetical protein
LLTPKEAADKADVAEQAKSLPSPDAEPRITTSEIAAIARVSTTTILRRADGKRLPRSIDHGKEHIFDRRAIYAALGIQQPDRNHVTKESENPWLRGARALANRRTS